MTLIALLMVTVQAATPPETVRDYDARPEEYGAAMPGEQFADALTNLCPKVLARSGSFNGLSEVQNLPSTPSFLKRYPATKWYALAAASRNIFLSIDAAAGKQTCRVVMANNNMAGWAHLSALAALTKIGATRLGPTEVHPRRNLLESILILPAKVDGTAFLVQTVPTVENAGRGWQATATAKLLSREEGLALGVAF